MDEKLIAFQKLAKLFQDHGYHLYLVGGTVRDYLLRLPLSDLDAVSDATPEEIMAFLEPVDKSFAHLGSLKYKNEDGFKFDITTLRVEEGYFDNRHPSKITFVKDLKLDYPRRDFTINALYMDANLQIIDYVHGKSDLESHTLRMIGNPDIRLKEDPLRILRALRFHITFDLEIEKELLKSMYDNFALLTHLTDAKIKEELHKISPSKLAEIDKDEIFAQFDIANLRGVIK